MTDEEKLRNEIAAIREKLGGVMVDTYEKILKDAIPKNVHPLVAMEVDMSLIGLLGAQCTKRLNIICKLTGTDFDKTKESFFKKFEQFIDSCWVKD